MYSNFIVLYNNFIATYIHRVFSDGVGKDSKPEDLVETGAPGIVRLRVGGAEVKEVEYDLEGEYVVEGPAIRNEIA